MKFVKVTVPVYDDEGNWVEDKQLPINPNMIITYKEIIEESDISDGLGGSICYKRTAIQTLAGPPVIIKEDIDEFERILDELA
jgi:hypothetical protein